MQIQLLIENGGATSRFAKAEGAVMIGRDGGEVPVDIDLGEDMSVSRLHAKVSWEKGEYWIEDLKSKQGTLVNQERIAAQKAVRFGPGDIIRIGTSKISIDNAATPNSPGSPTANRQGGMSTAAPGAKEKPAGEAPGVEEEESALLPDADSGITLVSQLDATIGGLLGEKQRGTGLEQQFDRLCELALKVGAERDLDRVLQLAIEHSLGVIPKARRSALLMLEHGSGRLMLKAHSPADYRPPERLARQAMERCEGFVWVLSEIGSGTDFGEVGDGMCVPLLADGVAIGAMCVDAPPTADPFGESDLRVFRAIGQFISMAVEHHQSRALLARQMDLTDRLFRSRFPEKVRRTLVAAAAEGGLPIGTRRSMVTVLQSDVRGFTRLSEAIGPQRMSDLLNAYFPALLDAIFSHGGAIERFVGDAIFAVFGSPEPDPDQQEHAVQGALAMQQAAAEITAFREKRKLPICGIGIGVDCGEVLHGFIGNAESLEFAVIGDAANYSARYCNGANPGEILISPSVRAHVWKQAITEPRRILTKHEGEIEAHFVKGWRTPARG